MAGDVHHRLWIPVRLIQVEDILWLAVPGEHPFLIHVRDGPPGFRLREVELVPDGGAGQPGTRSDLSQVGLVEEPLPAAAEVESLGMERVDTLILSGPVLGDEDDLPRLARVAIVERVAKPVEGPAVPA